MITPHKSLDKPGLIYLAVNRVNNKVYVGQTRKALGVRAGTHATKARLGYKGHFYAAIRKYGFDSFDWAILQQCTTLEDLRLAERYWIQRLAAIAPTGYNLGSGGEGSGGVHQKSEKWLASVTSDEYRRKHSDRVKALRGTTGYAEQLQSQALRIGAVRAALTTEQREIWRINAANARRGVSTGMFGDKNVSKRPEVREKIRLSKLGIPRSEECKRKISETKARKKEITPCAQ